MVLAKRGEQLSTLASRASGDLKKQFFDKFSSELSVVVQAIISRSEDARALADRDDRWGSRYFEAKGSQGKEIGWKRSGLQIPPVSVVARAGLNIWHGSRPMKWRVEECYSNATKNVASYPNTYVQYIYIYSFSLFLICFMNSDTSIHVNSQARN